MQASQLPPDFTIPWANAAGVGYIRTIPTASQIGIQNGAASLTDGFPPDTMITPGAGGVPPFGQDFNGILQWVTRCCQAMQAGFFPKFDGTLSAAIGGYWSGAVIRSNDGHTLWLCTADNNTNDPNSVTTNWTPLGVRTVFGRTGPNITAQAGDYTAAQVGALPDNTFSALVGVNGYEINHATGLIDMWGETPVIAEDVEVAISFVMSGLPSGFPHACLNMQVTGDYGGHTDSDVIGQFNKSSLTSTGCTLMRDSGGGSGYNGVLHWRAKGW